MVWFTAMAVTVALLMASMTTLPSGPPPTTMLSVTAWPM